MSLSQKEIEEFSKAVFFAAQKVEKSAQRKVLKVLGVFLNGSSEHVQIAEDAVSEVVTSLIEGISDPVATVCKTEVKDEEEVTLEVGRQTYLWNQSKSDKEYLKKYILRGVHNFCATRAKRWSHGSDIDIPSDELLDEAEAKDKPAVRSRGARPNGFEGSDDEWISANTLDTDEFMSFTGLSANSIDSEAIALALKEKGLTDEEAFAFMKKAEYKYSEMAEKFGKSKDYYEQRVRDAKKKLGVKGHL